MAICSHLQSVETLLPAPAEHVCPECVAQGDTWVHLRVCQTCGHVGCCNSSKNKHATRHFKATEHPVVTSAEPGEQWAWCYIDEQMAEY
ncbi:UBP-type zinc finger domain-containing protein [Hymenobacter taeanensis]|uniref:UBP-type zinc finger domain-containing protein n=1 Tax=Hymenobacter taeanensis TaxID=2735321 RepID=A0A6M6BDI7_9BACT|nr:MULTISPECIES: UBP-type zinc finger domain-containing protein [Hymenobacter]QJX45898.1 UBP-type zinc finger domain-containing protein [Hymenobacter taeanensis]UOQ79745.1 UBP-type zinc finger domain-containing protein [Hymenobacter sp. 5414T-23]